MAKVVFKWRHLLIIVQADEYRTYDY